ncbi:MAG: tetratricopeptide repeat protein [Balneolia bacterium]|nr:tetratricopeptide repeat protein [Balneolia bacterium]
MSQVKFFLSSLFVAALLFSSLDYAEAQSRAEAVDSFNEAQDLLRANNFAEALVKFQETRSIAQAAGEDADDIRERAENQIPGVQVQIARAAYQAREFERAIDEFDKAAELADELGNSQVAQQVRNNTLVVLLQWGNTEYNNNNNDRAEQIYRMALERNENYPNPYYQLGLIERRRGNLDQALEYFDTAINLALSQNRQNVAESAEGAARDFLTFQGASQIEEGNYRRAIQLLTRSLEYDTNHAETYYRLSEAHNLLGNWSDAVSNANRALELEQGGQSARAKIYFELGTAYMNQNNESQACSAFRSASVGNFRAAAEHHLEHDLNCP